VFIDNLDAFTEALGVENAPSVVYLSMVGWPNPEERDDFIKKLTNIDPGDVNV
jgi:hypothetical protein